MPADDHLHVGRAGEMAAADYLRQRGCKILARNYRCRRGEIDIVALHGAVIVFVEVRTRAAHARIDPLESVDARKQKRLRAAARHYLSRHRLDDRPRRYDIIGVRRNCDGTLSCQWMEDAFGA